MARERSVAVWKVATTGSVGGPQREHARSTASPARAGGRTSNAPASSQRVTRADVTGPKLTRATDPL